MVVIVPKLSSKTKSLPKRRKRPAIPADNPAAQTEGDENAARIQKEDLQGLKYFDMLIPLLKRLHDEKCQRDKANNRELHFDQYCMLVLLYMFNPTVTSLRAIGQASELAKV